MTTDAMKAHEVVINPGTGEIEERKSWVPEIATGLSMLGVMGVALSYGLGYGGTPGTKVLQPATPPVAEAGGGGTMPSYNAAVDSLLLYDGFEWADSATLCTSSGWSCNVKPAVDTAGSYMTIDSVIFYAGTRSFKSFLGQECLTSSSSSHAGLERSWNDATPPTDREYVMEWWARYDSGYVWEDGSGCGRTEVKEFLNLRNTNQYMRFGWFVSQSGTCPGAARNDGDTIYSAPRWQFSSSIDTGTVYTALYNSCASPANPRYPQHTGASVKPDSIADEQWHHIMLYLKTESAYGALDGIVRAWVDSIPVLDYNGEAGGNLPDSVMTGDVSTYPFLGPASTFLQLAWTFNGGSPQQQSKWIDEFRIWAERGN